MDSMYAKLNLLSFGTDPLHFLQRCIQSLKMTQWVQDVKQIRSFKKKEARFSPLAQNLDYVTTEFMC